MTEVELNFKSDSKNVISAHQPLFQRIRGENDYGNFVLDGGRASFKSYDTCLAIITDMLFHAVKGQVMNAVVFMNKQSDIRKGVRKTFANVISNLGIESAFIFKMSPMEITLKQNGATHNVLWIEWTRW